MIRNAPSIALPKLPAVAALVASLLLSAAAVSADAGMSSAEAPFDTTMPVGIHARIHVYNVAGAIRVQGVANARTIHVQGVRRALGGNAGSILRQLPMRFVTEGDVLRIHPGFPVDWEEPHEIDYTITIPESFRFEALTQRGSIETNNIREVDIRATESSVNLIRTKIVTAETTTGSVQIDTTEGPIHVTTGSGNVRGFLKNDLRSIYIISQSGDISLDLPANPNIYLGVTTTNGEVATQGLRLENTTMTLFTLAGSVGTGELPITVSTGSGRVNVVTYGAVEEAPIDTTEHELIVRPDQPEPGPVVKVVSTAPMSAQSKTDTLRAAIIDTSHHEEIPVNLFMDGSMEGMVEETFGGAEGMVEESFGPSDMVETTEGEAPPDSAEAEAVEESMEESMEESPADSAETPGEAIEEGESESTEGASEEMIEEESGEATDETSETEGEEMTSEEEQASDEEAAPADDESAVEESADDGASSGEGSGEAEESGEELEDSSSDDGADEAGDSGEELEGSPSDDGADEAGDSGEELEGSPSDDGADEAGEADESADEGEASDSEGAEEPVGEGTSE